MSSDLKIAFSVLHDIGSKDLKQYLEAIKKDAAKVLKDVQILETELRNLVPPFLQQIDELLTKVDESLDKLSKMKAKDRESPEHLIARNQYPHFQELRSAVEFTKSRFTEVGIDFSSQSFNISATHVPFLYFVSGLGKITPDEKRELMVRLFKDVLGFVPVIDKAVSAGSLIETLQEWSKHESKLSDCINRVGWLIGVAEIVRYMREENLIHIRQLVADRKSEVQGFPGFITDYEAMYSKLTQATDGL